MNVATAIDAPRPAHPVIREIALWAGLEPWVLRVFVIVLITAVAAFAVRAGIRRLETAQKTRTFWDDALLRALHRPVGVLIWVFGLAFAIDVIQYYTQVEIFALAGLARDVVLIVCLAWFVVSFISRAEEGYLAQQVRRGLAVDHGRVDSVAKLLRITVAVTAALIVLQSLGFSVSGVLAFGGLGGLAVGFAAKDLLANFFGAVIVYFDRPFAVGEWIRSPDRQIEGTVEEIGWRVTQIRTFDQRPLYVPNSVFTQIAVENASRMSNRRVLEILGLRHEDAERVPGIVADIQAMLASHAEIDQSKALTVHLDKVSQSSLDVQLQCFTKTCVAKEFFAVKQDVLLRAIAIVAAHGAAIAVPETTVRTPATLRS
jgi:MscS family membrane protein